MIKFEHNEFGADQLRRSVFDILETNTLLALATVKGASGSYVNTAYYCFNADLQLYILTEPSSQHCKNLEENRSIAVAVYDSAQPWNQPKRGLQLFGAGSRSSEAEEREALTLYSHRFPDLSKWIRSPGDFNAGIINSRFYTLSVTSLKVFDEVNIAPDRFIAVTLDRT